MNYPADDSVLLTVRIPHGLLDALRKAEDEAGERRDHTIVNRLVSSLSVDEAKRLRGQA